jgi:molybdopterin-guanine dinucleotide biosynthesis protein B
MALEISVPILQIVGYQNSGKTTLMTKLVERLSSEGVSVGTIKHHGHGGEPEIGDQGKDTDLHRKAGASVVAVEGEGTLQLTARNSYWELQKMVELYKVFEVDIILVEGYKKEDYPKIVLLRGDEAEELLSQLTNIMCVVSRIPISKVKDDCTPYFLRVDDEEYLSYIVNQVRGQRR